MPTLSSPQLDLVVDALLQSRTDGHDEAQLVYVQVTEDGFDLGLKPIDGHPSEHLLGFVAPDEWDAFGLASSGWAAPAGAIRPSSHRKRTRVDSAVLVARDGTVTGKVTSAQGVLVDTPPSDGLLLECLQRALGLPTAPPEHSTRELFALQWMENICATGHGRRSLGWSDVAVLHPASQLLGADDDPPDPRRLVEWSLALARVCDWPEVRWRAIEHAWLEPMVSGTLAGWMDDGMFARWVCPPGALTAGLSAASTSLTPRARREVRRVIQLPDRTNGMHSAESG